MICKDCALGNSSSFVGEDRRHFTGKIPVLILGEAPGEEENHAGIPFIGASGKLLRRSLDFLKVNDYVIDNVVRCRPPKNRDPSKEELKACNKHTLDLFERYIPNVVIAVGKVPTEYLLSISELSIEGVDTSLFRGRKIFCRIKLKSGYHYYWLCPVYHPSFLVRNGINLTSFGIPSKTGKYPFLLGTFINDIRKAFSIDEDVNTHFFDTTTDNIFLVSAKDLLDIVLPNLVSIDIETNAKKIYNGGILEYFAVSTGHNTYVVALCRNNPTDFIKALEYAVVGRTVIVHSMTMELEWFIHLLGRDIINRCRVEDTLVQEYCISTIPKRNLGLNFLSRVYLGIPIKELTSVDRTNTSKSTVEDVALYNGLDAKATYFLYIIQKGIIKKQRLQKSYAVHRSNLVVGACLQYEGLLVDKSVINDMFLELDNKSKRLEQFLIESPISLVYTHSYGKIPNMKSPKVLTFILKAVLPPNIYKELLKKYSVSNGELSTGSDVLTEIKDVTTSESLIAFLDALIEYKDVSKLLSTYVEPIQKGDIVCDDGCLHTSILLGTRTGRFSSKDPNLQNLPKRGGSTYRNIIVPKKGKSFIDIDLSQAEARIMAAASQDKALVSYMRGGGDIHGFFTKHFLENPFFVRYIQSLLPEGTPPEKVFKRARDHVKSWVFALMYLAGDNKLASYMHMPFNDAQAVKRLFQNMFFDFKNWQNTLLDDAYLTDSITTPTGCKIFGPFGIPSDVVNYPIQNASNAMITNIGYRIRCKYENIVPILQIHDELLFEVPVDYIEKAIEIIKHEALTIALYPKWWQQWLSLIPFGISIKTGVRFGSLTSIGEFYSDYKAD